MAYQAKNYEALLGTAGFSDQLLKNHFTLYQGYVTNVNKLADDLAASQKGGWLGTPGYSELKRRFGWEFDGMRLHEFYFENMSKGGNLLKVDSPLYKKIAEHFGNFENWEKDFRATGSIRGIGWAILYYDREADRLFNVWINEHDTGHFAGCEILLVMDAFEHAFMLDYGTKRADYIDAFMKAVDWNAVEKRF
jgi:Fe-Mn family superoxide dismutase